MKDESPLLPRSILHFTSPRTRKTQKQKTVTKALLLAVSKPEVHPLNIENCLHNILYSIWLPL